MSFKRQTLWRAFADLPNGQVAMLQAALLARDDGEIWGIAACIESSRRACKRMRREGQTTGKAGLKGLRALLTMLRRAERDLANTRKCANLRVQIEGKTQKMHDAYKCLARFRYAEYCSTDGDWWFDKTIRQFGNVRLFDTGRLPSGKVGDSLIVDVGNAEINMTCTSDDWWVEAGCDGDIMPGLKGDRFLGLFSTTEQLPVVSWRHGVEG